MNLLLILFVPSTMMYACMYVFIHLFIFLFISLFISLFLSLFIYLSIYLFIYLFVYLFIGIFICLIILYWSIYLSIYSFLLPIDQVNGIGVTLENPLFVRRKYHPQLPPHPEWNYLQWLNCRFYVLCVTRSPLGGKFGEMVLSRQMLARAWRRREVAFAVRCFSID